MKSPVELLRAWDWEQVPPVSLDRARQCGERFRSASGAESKKIGLSVGVSCLRSVAEYPREHGISVEQGGHVVSFFKLFGVVVFQRCAVR